MRGNTVLDFEVSGLGLEDNGEVVAKRETWKTKPGLGRSQPLDRQSMSLGRQQCSRDRLARGTSGDEKPNGMQQLPTRFALELIPEVVSPMEKGDVIRVLEIRLADDPCFAVGTAAVVRDAEL